MKFLQSFIASLLTPLIFGAILALIANATILNAEYLEHVSDKTHTYDALAQALPRLVAHGNTMSPAERDQLEKRVSSAIQPDDIKQKVDSFLTGLRDHYASGGPLPALDVSDLAAKLRQSGIDIPENQVPKTITIPPESDAKIKNSLSQATIIGKGTLAITLGLLLILLILSFKTHSYHSLIMVLFINSLLLGGLAFVLQVSLEWGLAMLKDKAANVQDFLPIISGFSRELMRGIETRLLYWAIGCFALTLFMFGLATISHFRRKAPKPKPASASLAPKTA